MTSPPRLLAAAACFALALGLPFGASAKTIAMPGVLLAQPILVTEPGTRGYGPGGEPLAIPGRLRMQYVPLYLPGTVVTVGERATGAARTTRVPLVALLAVALVGWRRRSTSLARRAALAGGVALVATGLVGALPSSGAVVSILGVALLASVPASAPRRAEAP